MTAARALVVIAAIAGARLAGAAPFHAEPPVRVVEVAGNGTGSAMVVLRNDATSAVVATSIVAAPGCDGGFVHAAPLAGFTLAPGAARPITISCTAAPPSMRRCTYQVRATTDVLLEFEAVCAYGGATTLAAGVTEVNFGGVAVGTTAARTITLTNGDVAAFDHLFFETTDLGSNFAVAAPCNPDARECDAAIAPVAPTASTDIVVTCTPHAAGPQSAQLHVTTSAGSRLAAPVALTGAALAAPDPRITLSALPATTPATLDLTAAPDGDPPLDNRLTVTPATGPALDLAISGGVVVAKYAVPAAISLGTFCVQQPTTPRTVVLASTGTATLGLSTPALRGAGSPFDLELVAPLSYPAEIPALARALVTVTPRRQTVAGMVADVLTWTTDADGTSATSQTVLSATFVDDGPAVAPTSLTFPQTTIHLDSGNAQSVTLRNCSSSALQLDAPQIPAPFTIDSPSFPSALMPGETATFSVGFHPTKAGVVTKELVITSPQLRDTTFTVTLTGEGITDDHPGSGSGSGSVEVPLGSTSFYSCGSCASNDASGLVAFALAALCVLVPRRRLAARFRR